jgi:hypothetical protein
MTRLLTVVALGLAMAFAPTPSQAASKRIHVIAKVAQQTFTGDLARPKLGDRIIQNVELFDESDTKVGAGGMYYRQHSGISPGHARTVPSLGGSGI